MNPSTDYILVIGQPSNGLQSTFQSATQAIDCPVVITNSPDQAIAQAEADHPYLVILSGDANQSWSRQIARRIRQSIQPEGVVIVALTQSSELSWHSPENTDIDGFFVEPLSADILSTLTESAIAKKKYLHSNLRIAASNANA
jgi:DNA-binding NarL/FixJ family response regulator